MTLRKAKLTLILAALFVSFTTLAQKKIVTLDHVWKYYTFYPRSQSSPNWMNDGQFYTDLKKNSLTKYDVVTGKSVKTLIPSSKLNGIKASGYQLNSTEDKVVIKSNVKSIYRHSYLANYHVYDLKSEKLTKISDKKISYCTLSPDGQMVAYVRDNNLYMMGLSDLNEIAITTDGKFNHIINGSTDWVYEEEFAFPKAFFWAPDSKNIAFYRFDESNVKEYNMQEWTNTLYPKDYKFKYPKAGEANSEVEIKVYNLDNKTTKNIDLGTEKDIYIPRVMWTQNPDILSVRKLNRLQNKLDLIHANIKTGKNKIVIHEQSDTYVNVEFTDDLTYLKDKKTFIFSSEKSGFKHLYHYKMSGKQIRQITSGNWEIDKITGIDEKGKKIYFTATKDGSINRHLYTVNFKGGKVNKLTKEEGTHHINMSKDCKYYLDNYSTANVPAVYQLCKTSDGKAYKVIEDNKQLSTKLKNYQIQKKTFFTIKNKEGIDLNAWKILPANFKKDKKYPVLMFVYGGPGNQQVTNSWDSFNYFWYQHLASQGYMIVCVDNRGTGGKGTKFRNATYKQLGKLEVEDQIDAAKYLGTLPYVDAKRIGIWGWSFGGYMSALCITKGADVFSTAISVAPVTTWRFYDTIYTERFLQRPQDNPSGYDDNSPINHAHKLKGKYLLIHGTSDDNVHFQNAVILQNALIKAGKQFQSFYYPNRNHGISGGYTRLHLYHMMTDFIKDNL